MRRLIVSEDADRDLDTQLEFLVDRDADAALRLLDAVQAAYDRLLAMPEVGSLCTKLNPRFQNLRAWPVPDFPKYLIHYRLVADRVEIVRILHSSQDRETILGEQ